MLEKLFTSKARIKILGLFLKASKPMYAREISRETGVSPPYVKKEIEGLIEMGLLKESLQGKITTYEMNRGSPIYGEIRGIFIKTEMAGSVIRDALGPKGRDYARIYGSFARGDERDGSDIDLLVVGSVSEDDLLASARKIEEKTGREVNYILWTKEELREKARKGSDLVREIIRNTVIMLMGEFDEFRKDAEG